MTGTVQQGLGLVEMKVSPLPVALVAGELRRGGAERVLVDIANRLDRNRFKPLVVTTGNPGPLASELNDDVECFSLNRRHRWDPFSVVRLARFLDQRNVGIVHSHNHFASYFVRIARTAGRGRWSQVVHDHHGPAVGSRRLGVLDRIFLRNADAYVATSMALADRARRVVGVPEARVRLLYNGIEIPPPMPKVPGERPTIVQVGRLTKVKNQMMAVNAAEVLWTKGIAFRWVLVGGAEDKEYEAELKREISARGLEGIVVLAGESADVQGLLANATLGVLTSLYEGLSIAVLEYMAAGLPVVITPVGETADLVENAGGGRVVPHGEPGRISSALEWLLKNEAVVSEWGAKNREYVKTVHTSSLMVSRLMGFYDEVVANTRNLGISGSGRMPGDI